MQGRATLQQFLNMSSVGEHIIWLMSGTDVVEKTSANIAFWPTHATPTTIRWNYPLNHAVLLNILCVIHSVHDAFISENRGNK